MHSPLRIREAFDSDRARLVQMGQSFLDSSPYKALIAKNPEQMLSLATSLQYGGKILVLENDAGFAVGMLGFGLFSHPMSGEKMAGELFWWVEPEFRGRGRQLLLEAEVMARACGAVAMQMVAPDERVGRFYERNGYREVETTYQKRLQ